MTAQALHNVMNQSTIFPGNGASSVPGSRRRLSLRWLSLRCLYLALALLTFAGIVSPSYAQQAAGTIGAAGKSRIESEYGKVPLSFEPNKGQSDARVQFLARGAGYGLFLTPGEAVLQLQKKTPAAKDKLLVSKSASLETATLRMKLIGANPDAAVAGEDALPGTVNYFQGNDPKQWSTAVKTYRRVNYTGVYPGIDLVYYGNQRELEYDFVVAPGADAGRIALKFTGATPKLDEGGSLVLTTKTGSSSFHKPVVYQQAGATRTLIAGSYRIHGQRVGFELGSYDHGRPLVIDPILTYATFLGGNQQDTGAAIAADAAGNTYIVGDTASFNFPTANAIQSANRGVSNGFNIFVTKLNATGTAIVYSTYLGGIYDSHGMGLAVDAAGSAYVVGYTSSNDFPVTAGAYQTLCGAARDSQGNREAVCGPAGDQSATVTKLSPSGTSLVYSTFLSDVSVPYAAAVDSAGELYVTGDTQAYCGNGPYYPTAPGGYSAYQCFPTTSGAFQNGTLVANGGGVTQFAFLTKFSADGASLLYSTLYGAVPNSSGPGGQAYTHPFAVAIDAAGSAYIAGNSGGPGLPTTANAFYVVPPYVAGAFLPQAAFVAKINPALSGTASLVYATYLGSAAQTAIATNYNNTATGIAVDANGDAIVGGYTNICGYPTTAGAYQTVTDAPACNDGFVTEVEPDGTGLVWSTLLGSTVPANTQPGVNATSTRINGLSLGGNGNIYVTGTIGGTTFPTVNPIRPLVNGGAFVSEFNSTGSSLLFSSAISGYGGSDYGSGIAVDASGNMYLTGKVDAATPTIPVTSGAPQATFGGGAYDAYAIKIAPQASSTTALALSGSAISYGTSVTLTATVTGATTSPVPTGTVTFLNGTTTLGTGTLDGTGKATYSSSTLAATSYTITARYAGDINFTGSTSASQTLVVNPLVTTTALTIAPAASNVFGTSVSLTGKVTPASGSGIPSGTITFFNGTKQIAAVAVDSTGKAVYTSTTLAVGSYSITAAYSGDSTNASSTSAAGALAITAVTTTALSASATTVVSGVSLTFTAIVTPASGTIVPTGTVTFKDGSTTLGTGTLDTTGKTTYATSALTVGAHSITASYAGDAGNAASTSATLAVTVNTPPVPDFTFALGTTSQTIAAGSTVTTTITATPVNGFSTTINFNCSGLPSYSSCTFTPSTLTPTGTAPVTSTLVIATNVGVAMNHDRLFPIDPRNRIELAGLVGGFLLLPLLGRRKLRGALKLTAVLVAAGLALAGVTGCGSSNFNHTPAGAYAITVTATAGTTVHTATYTVTVQ